ncbi:MAG TPA: nitroreductase family protein, partial [Ktedonobacteraceae bacterium]|nr:nitroreductase family protein [Ktedonobacteraceae bacterium]
MQALSANPRHIDERNFPVDGTLEEQWCFWLQYALLAPSEYNTQPWLFHIRGDSVEVYLDWSRRLPIVDPEDRELLISAGAACLNLQMAIRHFGYQVQTEYLLDDLANSALLARLSRGLKQAPTMEEDHLFLAIPQRRSNRTPFSERGVPEAIVKRLELQAGREGAWLMALDDPSLRLEIAQLIREGDQLQWADKAFRAELAQWLHPRFPTNSDGLPGEVEPRGSSQKTTNPLVVRTVNRWADEFVRDQQLVGGAPLLVILGTFADTRADWFAAGMAAERVLLEACAGGLQTSFVNQPNQNPALRKKLCQLLGRKDSPQLVLRFGY